MMAIDALVGPFYSWASCFLGIAVGALSPAPSACGAQSPPRFWCASQPSSSGGRGSEASRLHQPALRRRCCYRV